MLTSFGVTAKYSLSSKQNINEESKCHGMLKWSSDNNVSMRHCGRILSAANRSVLEYYLYHL